MRSAMEGLNQTILIGNLGADPELRMTPNGQAVLKLRVATTEVYFDKDKVKQERTEWHRVTVWGKRGESLSRILSKGMRVTVIGRIHNSSYEKDGVKHYSTEIVGDKVYLPGLSRQNGAMPAIPPAEPAGGADLDIPF